MTESVPRGTAQNKCQAIVRNDDDRRFLDALDASALLHEVINASLLLIDNHSHALIDAPQVNLGAFMQKFQARYLVWFDQACRRAIGGSRSVSVASQLAFTFESGTNIDGRETDVESILQLKLRAYGQGCCFAACSIVLAAAFG